MNFLNNHIRAIRLPKGIATLLLLQACATPVQDEGLDPLVVRGTLLQPAKPVNTQAVTSAEEAEIEYRSFTEEQLYQTIISELSAQRGEVAEAGDNYFDLALETRDLAVIQRAMQFASINNDVNALLQLGLLWAEVEPDAAQPHLMLSFQFLETGNFDQALSHMARVIELGGEIDFSALATRTGQLNPATRADLIENLQRLTEEFAGQQSIRIALIQLLAQNGEYELALEEFDLLTELMDLNPSLVLLQAQILQRTGDSEAAERALRNGVRDFETDKNLRLSYARLLIQNQSFEVAQDQFAILVEQNPQDWETLFSMALLDIEMGNFPGASDKFNHLLAVDQRVDEANYYLGYVSKQLGDIPQAIKHYRDVRIGTQNFLAAQQLATRMSIDLGELDDAHAHLMRLSRSQTQLEILFNTIESGVLIQAGYTDEARNLLDTALNRYPNETDLLFARVLLHDNLGDMAGSERDLRQIIFMKPDDSRALNHLGYMLADQTTRFDEALELLEQAIAISPDDPAIIDSLGWVQYKLGRYEEALANLRRAFAVFPDHEVASHVGEVLWKMGRQEEATQVWLDALKQTPDSELITEAMQRLQPES